MEILRFIVKTASFKRLLNGNLLGSLSLSPSNSLAHPACSLVSVAAVSVWRLRSRAHYDRFSMIYEPMLFMMLMSTIWWANKHNSRTNMCILTVRQTDTCTPNHSHSSNAPNHSPPILHNPVNGLWSTYVNTRTHTQRNAHSFCWLKLAYLSILEPRRQLCY